MPENIKQTFIFDVRFLHREQNGGKFESKHQIYYYNLGAKVKQNMCKLDIYSTFTPPLQKSKLSLLNKICTKNK